MGERTLRSKRSWIVTPTGKMLFMTTNHIRLVYNWISTHSRNLASKDSGCDLEHEAGMYFTLWQRTPHNH